MVRHAPVIFVALLCVAGAARAQEAIPTASAASAGGAPPGVPAPPPPLDPDARPPLAEAGPAYGPCGPLRRTADGRIASAAHQAHGEVVAGVGTGGYREAGAVVCQPIGDNAAVTIGVDATRFSGRSARWR